MSASSQIAAGIFSPLSSKRRTTTSPFPGTRSGMLYRSRSLEVVNGEGWRNKGQSLRRAASATFDTFAEDDDEFVKRLQQLVLGCQQGGDNYNEGFNQESERRSSRVDQPWQSNRMGAPDWGDSIAIPSTMERIANSIDLPVSLRIIKQKKKKNNQQWGDGFREAGECARSSVQKAFSSMVFMIRELHCYTLEMRQAFFYEDVKGILGRVQHEMQDSFVWLFQQIFSGSPTLMVSLMLLLANFTVYSMSNSVAMAAPLPPQSSVASTVDTTYNHHDHMPAKMTSNQGRTASVGGSGGGGGGKVRPVAGETDDGRPEVPSSYRPVISEGVSSVSGKTEEEAVIDEVAAWNAIVEEANKMQAAVKDESLMDKDVLKWMVAPVTVQIEADVSSDYMETELKYYQAIQEDPENSLLLSNFAQFLHLVVNDHDRAEYYHKKAVERKEDAEALNRYATFLWVAKDDVCAAEETYLQAIEAEPGNSYYAANYAHFLWNTGGEDTCFPLDDDDDCPSTT